MSFDWSFSSPKEGEVVTIDDVAARTAQTSFNPKVEMLGYRLDVPVVSVWKNIKIVRVVVYDPRDMRLVGKAIRLERDNHVEEAIEMTEPAE